MPVGTFKTFGECVRAQRSKGKSEDSARRICGELEKKSRAKEQKMDEKTRLKNEVYAKAHGYKLDSAGRVVIAEKVQFKINANITPVKEEKEEETNSFEGMK